MVKQHFDRLPQEISSDDESLIADEHMREFFRRTMGIKKDSVTGERMYDDDLEEGLDLTREVAQELR